MRKINTKIQDFARSKIKYEPKLFYHEQPIIKELGLIHCLKSKYCNKF
jgi:hypothetical protein